MTAAAAVDDRPAPQAPALAEAPQPTGEMPSAGDRLKQVAIAALDKLAGAAVVKVEELSDKLGDMAADAVSGNMPTGVGANALMKGVLAKMEGKNPVIAALKGAFGAMSTSTKILAVARADPARGPVPRRAARAGARAARRRDRGGGQGLAFRPRRPDRGVPTPAFLPRTHDRGPAVETAGPRCAAGSALADADDLLGQRGVARLGGGDDTRAVLVRLFVDDDLVQVLDLVELLDLRDGVVHAELVVLADRQLRGVQRTEAGAGLVQRLGGVGGALTAADLLGAVERGVAAGDDDVAGVLTEAGGAVRGVGDDGADLLASAAAGARPSG